MLGVAGGEGGADQIAAKAHELSFTLPGQDVVLRWSEDACYVSGWGVGTMAPVGHRPQGWGDSHSF